MPGTSTSFSTSASKAWAFSLILAAAMSLSPLLQVDDLAALACFEVDRPLPKLLSNLHEERPRLTHLFTRDHDFKPAGLFLIDSAIGCEPGSRREAFKSVA